MIIMLFICLFIGFMLFFMIRNNVPVVVTNYSQYDDTFLFLYTIDAT